MGVECTQVEEVNCPNKVFVFSRGLFIKCKRASKQKNKEIVTPAVSYSGKKKHKKHRCSQVHAGPVPAHLYKTGGACTAAPSCWGWRCKTDALISRFVCLSALFWSVHGHL